MHPLCFAACFPRGGRGFSVEPPIADSRPFPSAFFPSLVAAIFGNADAPLSLLTEIFLSRYVPFFPRLTDSRGSRLSETSCESNSLRGIGIMDVRNSGFRVFDNYLTVGGWLIKNYVFFGIFGEKGESRIRFDYGLVQCYSRYKSWWTINESLSWKLKEETGEWYLVNRRKWRNGMGARKKGNGERRNCARKIKGRK